MHNALDTIDNTLSSLRATGEMLECLIDTGDDHRCHSDGIHILLSQQFDDLENAVNIVRDGISEFKASGLEIEDPAVVAKLTGVSLTSVKAVLWTACGVDVERFTDTALADDDALYEVFRAKFRAADLVERARGTVSEWSGVAPETVEKVLHAANEAATEFMYRTHKSDRSPEILELDADVQAALTKYREAEAANEKVSPAEPLEGPIPDHFRDEALAERLRAGVDPSKIAKAVNLKPETVERVIAQLLAEPTEADKATGTEG